MQKLVSIFKHKINLNTAYLFVICVILLNLFLHNTYSSVVCEIDFAQVEYTVVSGDYIYVLEETGQRVIKNNLSSHPLNIIISQPTSESNCHTQEDIVLVSSGTVSFPKDFSIQTVDEDNYLANWIFEIPEDEVFTSDISFKFSSYEERQESDVLSLRVDTQNPSINFENVKRNNDLIDLENPVRQSQLKSGDIITIKFNILDDISVNSFQIRSIQGGQLVSNISQYNSIDNMDLFVEMILEDSPLNFEVVAFDEFGSFETQQFSIHFDSFDPVISSLDITALEVTNDLKHIISGEITIRDDFEIVSNAVTLVSRLEDLILNYEIYSCSTQDSEDVLKTTTCLFRSQPVHVDSTFQTNFSVRVFDIVRNEVVTNFTKTIEIENQGPEIHNFELLNPINRSNILSSFNNENSKIILEYSNNLPSLYIDSNSNNPQRVRIQTNFQPFSNMPSPDCEQVEIRTNRKRCVWEVEPQYVAGFQEFNISVVLTDIAGNSNTEEISITVNNKVPKITNLRIVERGNERNSILESYERVRIEFFVREVGLEDEFEVKIDGSNIIFRESPEAINFVCQYVQQSELGEDGQICFSDEFELNRGFEGDRTEDLRIIVTNYAGNRDVATKEVKIFKIHEGEAIDYFDLDFVELLTPLNRRVVQQQGMDVYHFFRLKPKNSNQEFRIVSVQLMGMGTSLEDNNEDVRLSSFELQNENSQGIVAGDNRDFFLKSFMPRLLSAHEMQGRTHSTVVLSIVKTDIDTIYKDENVTIRLPIEFYDLPRDLNSNIALAQKILGDIEGVNENIRKGKSLYDYYMMYYNICSVYSGISGAIQSLSLSWKTISLALSSMAPGMFASTDNAVGNTGKVNSMLRNINNVMGKICMLASCDFSQNLMGNALNSISGDLRVGDYLTGQRSFLGNMLCRPE
ncbi:MAG: hypothetical protein ACMXYB_01895 [Candidatus Woesearchaeota archaeon]